MPKLGYISNQILSYITINKPKFYSIVDNNWMQNDNIILPLDFKDVSNCAVIKIFVKPFSVLIIPILRWFDVQMM